jgi:hypothetical protein
VVACSTGSARHARNMGPERVGSESIRLTMSDGV